MTECAIECEAVANPGIIFRIPIKVLYSSIDCCRIVLYTYTIRQQPTTSKEHDNDNGNRQHEASR